MGWSSYSGWNDQGWSRPLGGAGASLITAMRQDTDAGNTVPFPTGGTPQDGDLLVLLFNVTSVGSPATTGVSLNSGAMTFLSGSNYSLNGSAGGPWGVSVFYKQISVTGGDTTHDITLPITGGKLPVECFLVRGPTSVGLGTGDSGTWSSGSNGQVVTTAFPTHANSAGILAWVDVAGGGSGPASQTGFLTDYYNQISGTQTYFVSAALHKFVGYAPGSTFPSQTFANFVGAPFSVLVELLN